MPQQTIYERNGYKNRADYVNQLALENNVPLHVVAQTAQLLGPDEDFDGLVAMIQDYDFYSDLADHF